MDDNDTDTSTSDSVSLVEKEIITVAWDMQNRGSQCIRAKVVGDRLFKEYFGVSVTIILVKWNLLDEHDLIPEKGEIKHHLWALVFLKVYPKQGLMCFLVGRTKGAIDPKTFRKWV
jgi:hypothetical protein